MHPSIFSSGIYHGALALSGHRSNGAAAGPASQCSAALKSSPGPTKNCGYAGTLSKASLISTSKVANGAGCVNTCFASDACVAFGYKAQGKSCQLYSKSLAAMGYAQAAKGPVKYYNRNCYTATCPNLLGEDGGFETNGWDAWSVFDAIGLTNGTGQPGRQSANDGYVTTSPDYDGSSSLVQFGAEYAGADGQGFPFTRGQAYTVELDYKPNLANCVTRFFAPAAYFSGPVSLGGFLNQFLVLGRNANITGEQVTLGQWSHHTATFNFPFVVTSDSAGLYLSTQCTSFNDAVNPPEKLVEVDNIKFSPIFRPPYALNDAVTGDNIVKNGGFDTKSFTGYQVLKGANTTTSFTKSPGFDRTPNALTVTTGTYDFSGGPDLTEVPGVILVQQVPTKKGKAYYFEVAYKVTVNNLGGVAFLVQLVDTAKVTKKQLQSFTTTGAPQTAYPPFNTAYVAALSTNNTDWTVPESIIVAPSDNSQLVVYLLSGGPAEMTVDGISLYEVA